MDQNKRTGRFTSSTIHKLMGAKGFGKTGETYIHEKVAEYLTGHPATPEFSSAATDWGEKYEPEADEYFTAATGLKLETCDTVTGELIVGTPDRYIIGQECGVEFKCPYNAGNHLQNLLLTNQDELLALRPEYYWQCYGYMWLKGWTQWKFASYHPQFPGEKRMIILNLTARDTEMQLLQNRVREATLLFNNLIAKLK